MSLVGQRLTAPLCHGSYVEGVITRHNLTDGTVTLVDEDDVKWVGQDYQLESNEE